MKSTNGPSAYCHDYNPNPPPAYGSAPSAFGSAPPAYDCAPPAYGSYGAPNKNSAILEYSASALPASFGGPVAGGMVNFTMRRENNKYPWGIDIVSEKSHVGRQVYYMNPPQAKSIAEYSGLGTIITPNTCMMIWEINGIDCGEWDKKTCERYVKNEKELTFGLLPCTLDVVQRVLNYSESTDALGNLKPIYKEAMDNR